MTPEWEDRILVWWHCETDLYSEEHCEWVAPASFGHLHFTVAEWINSALDECYSTFSEWFNLAEYPDVLEQLEEAEVAVFLKAAGAPDGTDFESIQKYDCFSGLCAVIRRRLAQRSPDQLTLAAELFNWTIEFGLFNCDTTGHATIKVGSAAEVAPFLIGRILSRLPDDSAQKNPAGEVGLSEFERRFLPLTPVLKMLSETMQSALWEQNRLALQLVFWVAELFSAPAVSHNTTGTPTRAKERIADQRGDETIADCLDPTTCVLSKHGSSHAS